MSFVKDRSRPRRLPPSRWLGLAFLATLVAGSASAAEVFHWVDADGKVHFSDTRPADETPVTTIELVDYPRSAYNPAEDPYSILNQASRIHERWVEINGAADEAGSSESATATPSAGSASTEPTIRYGTTLFYPARPPVVQRDPSRLARQQQYALDELELSGSQPASINSGAHAERVERSQALPLVPPPAAPPRPDPR